MGRNNKDDFEKAAEALFKGGLVLQATPLLRSAGRTPAALTRTLGGFVGIGIAGAVAQQSFRLVSPRKRFSRKKTKRKGR